MRHHACLSKAFWQDFIETSVHLYNRQPMCCYDWKTPIELFKGDRKKPDVSYFWVFGCKAYVFIPPEQWVDKLSPKSEEMIFIEYEPNTKGWCFWSKTKHQVVVATNATFDEESFPQCSKDQEDGPASIPIPDDDESDHESEIPWPKLLDQHERVPIPVPWGNSPQPPPIEFYGYGPYSKPSEPSEPSEKDIPQSSSESSSLSQTPSEQCLSPTKPDIKRQKPDSSQKLQLRMFIKERDFKFLILHQLHQLFQEKEYGIF